MSGNEAEYRTEEGEGQWRLIVTSRLGDSNIDRVSDNEEIWCLGWDRVGCWVVLGEDDTIEITGYCRHRDLVLNVVPFWV